MASGHDLAPQSFNFGPRPTSAGTKPKKLSEQETNAALQRGSQVLIQKRDHAVGNHHSAGPGANAKKLDEDTETLKIKHIAPQVSALIQRCRQQKNWKQEDLAREISERTSIVTEYENGKAIPNEQILVRMEKALGVYLRGAKAGQPREDKKPQPKAAPAPQ